MRYLSMVRVKETSQKPSERLMGEMGKLMEEMTANGTLVMTAGLLPTSEGFRMRSNYGKLSTVDGPFAETHEVVGGFAIMEAASKEDAVRLTKRFLDVHGTEYDVECEVRPMFGPGEGC